MEMNAWIPDLLWLAAGVACAWSGGEFFVRGLHGVSVRLRVPARLAGVTLGAFATSAPEVSVAVQAAVAGVPVISVGDVTGANVVNVALILAVALLPGPLTARWNDISRDFLTTLAVPLLLAALLSDSLLSRTDGLVLMVVFIFWLGSVIAEGLRHRTLGAGAAPAHGPSWRLSAGLSAGGLALLSFAGYFIVQGAKGVGLRIGMTEFTVGAVVVAAATCTPELATTLVARLKGHHELGLGNILGSNIFNGIFIVGLVALISPCPLPLATVAPALVTGALTTLLCLPVQGRIPAARGWLLLTVYGLWLFIILRHGG
jgi:cation:H+ antiporter